MRKFKDDERKIQRTYNFYKNNINKDSTYYPIALLVLKVYKR